MYGIAFHVSRVVLTNRMLYENIHAAAHNVGQIILFVSRVLGIMILYGLSTLS